MRYDISRRRTLPLGAVLWAALACQCWAAVLYVDDDAPPGGNGSSWQTAFRYLQDALTAAATAEKPLEIRVAQGVYKPDQGVGQTAGDRLASFDLFSGVVLKGGYAGVDTPDPDVRDTKLYETVLSGDLAGNDVEVSDPRGIAGEPTRSENSCNVVRIMHASDVRMEGLTITGGACEYLKTRWGCDYIDGRRGICGVQ
jgi:hypothetical protein